MWVSHFKRQDIFWRSAMSGGRATLLSRNKRQKGFVQPGDITAVDPLGHIVTQLFCVEAKFYKDLFMFSPVWGDKGYMDLIWHKPLAEARAANREPMVVAKQNMKPALMLTTEAGSVILGSALRHPEDGGFSLRCRFPSLDMYIYQFADMLTDVEVDILREKYARPQVEGEAV